MSLRGYKLKLKGLIKKIEPAAVYGASEHEVRGISYHSAHVGQGDIFVAMKGAKADGRDYAPEAMAKGAAAIVMESKDGALNCDHLLGKGATIIIVRDAREALAKLSCAFYKDPSKQVKLIGVTGTNGKTTTTYLLDSVFKEAGYKGAIIGTISHKIADQAIPSSQTTPESLDLQKMLRAMADQGVSFCAMEVSSHALDQKRVAGCFFEVAIFTNFTQDHLDYHRTMEEYFAAKRKLFTQHPVKCALINADDPRGAEIVHGARYKVLKYGLTPDADFRADLITSDTRGNSFRVSFGGCAHQINLKLLGHHNIYNALAAFAASVNLGIEPEKAVKAIESVQSVPGRFELVSRDCDFAVIVDYAHTEDALRKLLYSARRLWIGRLITVFGCGGERDKLKRPLMGEAAASLSDYVVITSDNPRAEEPQRIIDEIEVGLRRVEARKGLYTKIADRRAAVNFAVEMAEAGDVVVIAGKGHENYQVIGGKRLEFDDKVVAKEAIKAKLKCART